MSVTYIVPWEQFIPGEFIDEFEKIARAFAFAGSDPIMRERVRSGIKPELYEIYLTIIEKMQKAGYELQKETDTGRWRCWSSPYLEEEQLRMKTTAPEGRVYISMADLHSYMRLCFLPDQDENGRDNNITEKLKAHARYMANKYDVTPDYDSLPLPDPKDYGPMARQVGMVFKHPIWGQDVEGFGPRGVGEETKAQKSQAG